MFCVNALQIEAERSKANQEEEAASLALIQKLVESEPELKILSSKNNASILPDQRVTSIHFNTKPVPI